VTANLGARIRRLLEPAVRSGIAPGLVAGWMRAGEGSPTAVAVGNAVVGRPPTPVSPATWFDLASLTKPLVVGTSSLLAMRGSDLTLATTVAEVFPAATGNTIGDRTVRQLLTHTSGLPAWAPVYALAESREQPAILEALASLPVGEPDTHVVYSCPGFILLGMMLERVTGVPLDRFFVERVLRPLGIEDELGYRPEGSRPLAGGAAAADAEHRLVGELGLDPKRIPAVGPGMPDDGNARYLGGVSGNAGLFGTVVGVLALASSYLDARSLLTADERRLATTNHTPGLEQARGLGWQLAGSPGCSAGPALAPEAFGHTGFTGSSVWVDPPSGLTMALLANRVHPGHRETDLHPLRRRFHQLVVEMLG
jgi:CubicO group peptidase (beta-lactamase class C family)